MSRRTRRSQFLLTFLVFFALVAFVVSCCVMVFVTFLTREYALVLDEAHIQLAAKLTLVNILFLTLSFTVIDLLRRRRTVEAPVRQILEGTRKITGGDFSCTIPLLTGRDDYGFNLIIRDLNQMARELGSIEALRSDFVSTISHELKTPLAIISNYASMLDQPGLSRQEQTEYVTAIGKAVSELSDLVSNILKLSRLEHQTIFPQQQLFDLSDQLCQCLLAFESVWSEKKLELETDLPDRLMIRSDPELLALVWNNLLSNAMKFTPAGGRISVLLREEEGCVSVTVSDIGCGIASEAARHIFEKFYQADSSHSTEGNGLGLALVRQVVDILGASITVGSSPGKGSSFTVRL